LVLVAVDGIFSKVAFKLAEHERPRILGAIVLLHEHLETRGLRVLLVRGGIALDVLVVSEPLGSGKLVVIHAAVVVRQEQLTGLNIGVVKANWYLAKTRCARSSIVSSITQQGLDARSCLCASRLLGTLKVVLIADTEALYTK